MDVGYSPMYIGLLWGGEGELRLGNRLCELLLVKRSCAWINHHHHLLVVWDGLMEPHVP